MLNLDVDSLKLDVEQRFEHIISTLFKSVVSGESLLTCATMVIFLVFRFAFTIMRTERAKSKVECNGYGLSARFTVEALRLGLEWKYSRSESHG